MPTITTINSGDTISGSRTTINDNFSNLNTAVLAITANSSAFNYIIYKSGSTTIAIKTSDGTTFSSNTNSATVIQAVLDLATALNILILDATYTITAALKFKAADQKIMGQGNNTIIQCDGASISPLISKNSTSFNYCQLKNVALLNTNGTPSGIALKVNDSAFDIYENIKITNFSVGLQLTDSVNTTFYNSFSNFNIFVTNTCVDIAPSGNPVNNNSFYRFRTDANASGYGVRIRSGANGNNFYSFEAEPESTTATKGVSIEGASYSNSFFGVYTEGNAVGVSIAAGCQANTFFGGNILGNTADIADSGNQNFFLNVNRTADIFTEMPIPFDIVDQTGNSNMLHVYNNTNFAHISAKLILLELLNSTDTSAVLQLAHAGTGAGTGTSLDILSGSLQYRLITKTILSANQNNYDIGNGIFFRMSSDASRDVTGLAGGVNGRVIHIRNIGAQNIVLKNNSASSSVGNKFAFSTGADITLAASGSISLMFDLTSNVWFDLK